MTLLLIGLLLFLGIHSISIISPSTRERLVNQLGEWPYKGVYSLIAITGLVLMSIGYGESRMDPTVLYTSPLWLRHITLLLVLMAFIALVATYIPGRINSTLKHPMLVAVKLWALSHLLVNGTLADVLLFGGFLVWAVADRISLKRRETRSIPMAPAGRFNDLLVLVLGVGFYIVFALWLHPALIGVAVVG